MSEFSIYLNGTKVKVILSENGSANVDDKNHSYELIHLGHSDFILNLDNKFHHIHYSPHSPDSYNILVDGKSYGLTVRTALQEKAAELIGKTSFKSSQTEIKAPMPGMILKINKSVSDAVKQGDSLMILEAMKMENDLRSPVSGTIKSIFVKEGAPVEKGALLFSIG